MDKKYRSKQKEIFSMLGDGALNKELVNQIDELLAQRSKKNTELIGRIEQNCLESSGALLKYDLLSSYVHMHMNRIFRSNQRQVEFLIYDFLYRYHKSVLARVAKNSSSKTYLI